MCTMVYLASDRPLPLIAWDSDVPAFHSESQETIKLAPEAFEKLRSRFSKPFVCRLGSNQHCGCGFSYFEQFEGGYYEPEELDAAERSRQSLASYLEEALRYQDSLELWICWAGDEGCKTDDRMDVRPGDFLDPELFMKERVLLTVSN